MTEPSLGELSRQVQGVLVRVENVVTKLEQQYVRNDIYRLWQQGIDERVKGLEDTNKWLVRLVLTFVVAGVLGASIVFGKGGG
jgi:hypothetical protein